MCYFTSFLVFQMGECYLCVWGTGKNGYLQKKKKNLASRMHLQRRKVTQEAVRLLQKKSTCQQAGRVGSHPEGRE